MKILLLSILLLPASLNSSARQSKPVSAPEALCTARVISSECQPITEFLALRQSASPAAQLSQFVIADEGAYKAEKQRLHNMQDNLLSRTTGKTQERALVAPDYLIAAPSGTIFELRETNHMITSKIYLNETTACHDEVSPTSSGAFDLDQCAGEIEYAIGFADGIMQGSNNVMNSLAIGQ
jgi:hypothetical protein